MKEEKHIDFKSRKRNMRKRVSSSIFMYIYICIERREKSEKEKSIVEHKVKQISTCQAFRNKRREYLIQSKAYIADAPVIQRGMTFTEEKLST